MKRAWSLMLLGAISGLSMEACGDDIGGPGRPPIFQPGQPGQQDARQYVNEGTPMAIRRRTTAGAYTNQLVQLRMGLLLSGYVHPYGGLVIRDLTPGGPATRMRDNFGRVFAMERGDVLEQINGLTIRSPYDYFTALDNASYQPNQPVQIAVRDIRSGDLNYFSTFLAPLP